MNTTGVSTSGDDSATSGDPSDQKLDVADGMGSAGDGDGKGCAGIDFLFVIDKSSSMTSKQQRLVDSFPGFVAAIEAKAAEMDANDFHILVTHTDTVGIVKVDQNCVYDCDSDAGFCSIDDSACAFSKEQGCVDICREDIDNSCMNGMACRDLLPECGACGCTLGSGRVDDKDDAPCGVDGSQRYLTSAQNDLDDTFACVAEVGIAGARERQVDAILNALEENGAGGCNEGFLREDAILVVTLITDEEDGEVAGNGVPEWNVGSAGTPAEWKQRLLDYKSGDDQAVVLLGLLGDLDEPNPQCACDINDPSCTVDGAEASPLLREFVTSLPKGATGSVCEPSYDPFFAQAVDLIEQTCEDFIPPVG